MSMCHFSSYPEVNWDAFKRMIDRSQGSGSVQKMLLNKQALELAFIRATRNDGVNGLRGALCRGEFFECIVRCAFAWAKSPKMLSDSLETFFELYVDTAYNAC